MFPYRFLRFFFQAEEYAALHDEYIKKSMERQLKEMLQLEQKAKDLDIKRDYHSRKILRHEHNSGLISTSPALLVFGNESYSFHQNKFADNWEHATTRKNLATECFSPYSRTAG